MKLSYVSFFLIYSNKKKLVNKPSTKYSLERSPAVTNPGRRPALSSTSGSYQLKAASIPSGGYEKNLAISNPSIDQKNSFEDPQSLSEEENSSKSEIRQIKKVPDQSTHPRKKKIKPKASDSGEDSLSTESIDENQEEQEDT